VIVLGDRDRSGEAVRSRGSRSFWWSCSFWGIEIVLVELFVLGDPAARQGSR